ncbi:DUF2515 domain-containing protein [Metabacillus sp. GX 13764]|uniref:DUF2515 family protein n=1 Tax=Metabacillus kandeliae TaxID=2900151 RepID=UPI001E4199C9|nr:DUF2515 family protein [Metabacillus kandeliae]MCD7033495.1 DUF2515 domain-containing protein [Metabacillus kandeliae]
MLLKKSPLILNQDEKQLVAQIKAERDHHNLNNVTRTKAYLDFYRSNPEIHWAFLAHMVSRNGGWSMTDLKSPHYGNLLKKKEQEDFYLFLEKANAFIFYDAYPQLLLYQHSKQQNKSLFSLLPAFAVSKFMEPVWNYFFHTKHSSLLTNALIKNEQELLQQRLVRLPHIQQVIFQNPKFFLQEFMGMTSVFFPYKKREKERTYSLAGVLVSHFKSAGHRIQTGKKLYAMLFGNPLLLQSCCQFAFLHPHCGSRNDYWPHLYSKDSGSSLLESTALKEAWPDHAHSFFSKEDWFTDMGLAEGFDAFDSAKVEDVSAKVLFNLAKLGPAHLIPKQVYELLP